MYRRPKFLEVLLEIRQEMARLADYDVDLFAEMVRSGKGSKGGTTYNLIEPEDENGKVPKQPARKQSKRKVSQKT
jgi:hypothetical protein